MCESEEFLHLAMREVEERTLQCHGEYEFRLKYTTNEQAWSDLYKRYKACIYFDKEYQKRHIKELEASLEHAEERLKVIPIEVAKQNAHVGIIGEWLLTRYNFTWKNIPYYIRSRDEMRKRLIVEIRKVKTNAAFTRAEIADMEQTLTIFENKMHETEKMDDDELKKRFKESELEVTFYQQRRAELLQEIDFAKEQLEKEVDIRRQMVNEIIVL